MAVARFVLWGSFGALAWTHVLYPAAVGVAARVRPRAVGRDPDLLPSVAVIVAAYNEEAVIERKVENLLALDYPPDRVEVVVASDASTDRTNALVAGIAAREPRVRVIDCERGGKVAAQNRAVRETSSDVVAFTDANATWARDTLRRLVACLADPEVAYVCGQLRLEDAQGGNQEGRYWQYELWLREQESQLGSVTGGNGSVYALRRADYVEVDPRWGHDLSLPYRMVQAGRRAVYEPRALAFEKPTPTNESEYRRKVRMFEHCWEITLRGAMFRRLPPGYLIAMVSHRALRYGSGLLHLALLASTIALVDDGFVYQTLLAGQIALLAAAAAGQPIARYYVLVTWATLVALWNYIRRGVPSHLDAAGGNPVNRAADVVAATLGLAVTSPLLVLAALAVKLEGGGPVLFRQTRVGRDGADFELLKLRTMVVGAERQGAGYAVAEGDSRITRVGRVLRRTSIDELPQLWNVLRGDMSLIGPRPTLRYQVERYSERQRRRLAVRPGLTGWAQVRGRAKLSWDERIELDVWYVEHRSPLLDLRILLRTPFALFGGTYKGDRGGWRGTDAQ